MNRKLSLKSVMLYAISFLVGAFIGWRSGWLARIEREKQTKKRIKNYVSKVVNETEQFRRSLADTQPIRISSQKE